MTAPHNKPGGADREFLPTASGLDESQIDAKDLQALHDAVRLRSLKPGVPSGAMKLKNRDCDLPAISISSLEPGFTPPRQLALRIVPLPQKAKIYHLSQPAFTMRLKHDQPLAQSQPIHRRKLRPDDLPEEKLKALFTRLFEKYGEQARQMEVAAVFPHVPPEAASAINVDPALAWAAFELPAGLAPGKARAGFYLIVLKTSAGETRKLLLRL